MIITGRSLIKRNDRRAHNGRFSRSCDTDRAHWMIQGWASEAILSLSTSQGQGYAVMMMGEGSGIPPHSLIPVGINFSSRETKLVDQWLWQASDLIRNNTVKIYLLHERASRDQRNYLLNKAAKYFFRR